ncbi:MAG: ATP-binding protein [Verrucomicrobiota bacterium]
MKPNSDPSAILPAPESRAGAAWLAVFLLLAAVLLVGGWLYYRNYARGFRAEADRQLTAIAALKVGELVRYRKERLGDAGLLQNNPVFSQLVRRCLESHEADARRQLQAWLGTFAAHYQYDRAILIDPQGAVRLAMPEVSEPVSAAGLAHATECLGTGQILMLDFFRHEYDQRVYLDVLTPIFDETDGHRPLGVVVFRIDPTATLYPFIQHWPVPSATGETLLVRREGSEVLYLNELRFDPGSALRRRSPLTTPALPAAAAALGRQGIMVGNDYRGHPVCAALQAVPDSGWFMIAKLDLTEVFAPLLQRLWQVLVTTVVSAVGAGVALAWHQQRAWVYRERALAADSLRESEENHRLLIENLSSGVVVHAADSAILLANPQAASLLGLTQSQLQGRVAIDPMWCFLQADGTPMAVAEYPVNQVLATGEPLVDQMLGIRRPDLERPVWVLCNAYPQCDAKGRLTQVVVHFYNITERKLAEEQLQRTMADLQRSNRELEQFASIASHDLQEPLRMVSSYVQLLAQRYEGQLDDKADKYIHYAVDGAIRMQTLINDLLDYSRVGLRGQPLAPIASQAALDQALVNLQPLIAENHADITHEDLPQVHADAAQLVLVFQNLIANAIKFRRPDCLPQIRVSARSGPGGWRFAVTDNGIGIEPQHAERVFQIFQRLHTRAEYPGTGIGLAICQRVIERHGGKIWFESTPGQGTTFFFTLPA